jgi:hypothetical protein
VKQFSRGSSRLRRALIASAVLHVGVIAVFWVSSSRGPQLPPLKVYAVNIVSPPPQAEGERAPEQAPPALEPAAEPEPAPPAPQPEPTPPVPEPTPPAAQPQRPAPQPQPASTPAPSPPQRPAPAQPPRQAAANQPQPPEPARPEPPREQTPPPRQTQASPPPAAEPAPRPSPSTGPSPAASSPGGENMAVRTEGAVCPSEAYCNNIAAMVKRYFRRPPDSYSDRGDVCFRIARNGSVSDLEVQRLRGSFAFRLALMEAVEQAGRRDEFGPLPREFGSDWLPVCVGVTPQM